MCVWHMDSDSELGVCGKSATRLRRERSGDGRPAIQIEISRDSDHRVHEIVLNAMYTSKLKYLYTLVFVFNIYYITLIFI